MTLSPVGEQMRARAEGALRTRYQVLLARSKRRALTVVERRELDGLGRSLDELLQLETPAARVPTPAP